MTTEDTLPKLVKRNFEKYGDKRVAMRKKEFGVWQSYTWEEYYKHVKFFSLGLISLGLEPGDKVSIIGDNDPEWYWAEFAAQAADGIPVGIFQDCAVPEVKYITGHSDSRFVVAKDQEQVDKILLIKEELPSLKKIIYWDSKGLWSYDEPDLLSFEQVEELGKEYERAHSGTFEQNVEKGKGEDIAFLAYTSGTTATPKGAPLSHENLLGYARAWLSLHPRHDTDQYLSIIAPAWAPEQWNGVAIPLLGATGVNFAEEAETVQVDMREVAPQLVTSPPRLWEGVASRIQALIIDARLVNQFLYHLCLPIGYKVADLVYEGKTPNFLWKTLKQLAEWAVFRPLKDKLGLLKVKVAMTAGGFLAPDTFRFFRALGVNIKQGYGLTEAGLGMSHRLDDVKYESVGQPMPGAEIRIAEDGEILVRGDMVFKGYYKDVETTEQRLTAGWFHSGDAGYFDEDGHFIILDRVADLMELAGKGKFSPSYIESRLRFSPYIRDVIIIGGKDKPYVTGIMNIDFDNVSRWAERHRIAYTTFVDLSQKPEVYNLIQKEIEKVNKSLPEIARVKKFTHLHKEFDADEAEVTRTRKVRRFYMESRYQSLINALYGLADEVTVEAEVKYRDGRTAIIKTPIKIMSLD